LKAPATATLFAASIFFFRAWRAGEVVDTTWWSAGLAAACVFLTYLLTRGWFGEWSALWTALVLATTPQFVVHSTTTLTGMAVTTLTLIAALAAFTGVSARPWHHVVAGVAIGLSILLAGAAGSLAVAPYAFLAVFRPEPTPGRPPLSRWWTQPQAWLGAIPAAGLPLVFQLTQGHVLSGYTADPRLGIRLVPAAVCFQYWPWLPLLIIGSRAVFRRLQSYDCRWDGMYVPLFTVLALLTATVYPGTEASGLLPAYPFLGMAVSLPLTRWISERRRPVVLRGLLTGSALIAAAGLLLP